MKRYISSSSKITSDKVYEYLKRHRRDDGELSDETLRDMAEELTDALHEEEMWSGELYNSLADAEIEDMLDSSNGHLYENGQIWLGFFDEDEED